MIHGRVPGTLRMEVSPVWQEIDRARDSCRDFLKSHGVEDDLSDSLCMILSELVENAIKYGHFHREGTTIPVSMEITFGEVLIQVSSPLPDHDVPFQLKRMDNIVQWTRSFQSPFQAYLERLKLVAGQPLDDNESGLGLVRIAYEGEAIIDFYANEEGVLSVSALIPTSNNRKVISNVS